MEEKMDMTAGVEVMMEENERCEEVEMVELHQDDQGKMATENVEQRAKRKTAEAEDDALSRTCNKRRSQGGEPEQRSGIGWTARGQRAVRQVTTRG